MILYNTYIVITLSYQDLALFGPNPWKFLAQTVYASSGQPNPWNKSWTANSSYENCVYISICVLVLCAERSGGARLLFACAR